MGASPRENSAGGAVMRTLRGLGFTGDLYPVNPRYEDVLGLRRYPSLSELPQTPDAVFSGLDAPAAPTRSGQRASAASGVR